jgi:hypothetical protein
MHEPNSCRWFGRPIRGFEPPRQSNRPARQSAAGNRCYTVSSNPPAGQTATQSPQWVHDEFAMD